MQSHVENYRLWQAAVLSADVACCGSYQTGTLDTALNAVACLLGRVWLIIVMARQRRCLRLCVLQIQNLRQAGFEPLGALLLSCFYS